MYYFVLNIEYIIIILIYNYKIYHHIHHAHKLFYYSSISKTYEGRLISP